MFKRSLSWFILVFTLLEFVVRTQLTAYDNSHESCFISVCEFPGFISNNHERYLASEISSMQEETSDIRTATINKLNKLQLKFDPEFLDFKQRPLGIPHLEKVTLFNVDRNQSIDMTSISGNTVHFHSSFFENKKIPPLGNTSFNVVFLGREEGPVESSLFIHTTDGYFKYHVKGASVYSPYRLRPIVGVKLPINTTFAPLIHLHNPYLEPIQIMEIYSSGGDFHLELPTGELEGPKDMWEIPPLQTKAIIKVRFFAKTEANHTAYIRIKLNNTDDILVVPLEVEVTSNALLYAAQGYVDFGIGGSLDPERELKLRLNNPQKKLFKIHSISTTSKAIKIENIAIEKENAEVADVALLKVNWKMAFDNGDFSGKIVVKYKNSRVVTEIPYFLTVIEGGLIFNTSTTRFFMSEKPEKINPRKVVIKNDFLTPIMLINISLPEEARKFFHITEFVPLILKQGQEKVVFNLRLNSGVSLSNIKLNTHILLNTNISTFQFPLVSYNGKFELKLPYKSKDNSLDLGLVSLESKKDTYILLINKNPVVINMKQLLTSLPSSMVEIVGCGKGNYQHMLLQESYKNMTKCAHIKAGEYAVLKLTVKTGRSEAQIWGDISVHTQYEQLSIPVHFKASHGKLEIGPDRLVFDQCFPGKICSHPLRVHSTYSDPMVIEDILSIPPDSRISSKHSGVIMARATKVIGQLYLDPNVDCQNECYLGFNEENRVNWWKTLSLSKSATEFDLNLVNILYNRYLNQTSNGLTRWQNLTIRLDTSEVKGHIFKTRVKMSWPSLLLDQTFENKSVYTFPLTQVDTITYKNITIRNPSSYDLIVQIIMHQFYPGYDVLFEGLPPVFIPDDAESLRKPQHGFFLEKTLSNLFESVLTVHEATLPILLKPNENYTFRIGFKALDVHTNSAFVFLRNNLTVLEVLQLSGKGAIPNFRFGNRKPGSGQELSFELTEKHLKDCDWQKKRSSRPNLTVKRSFTARNLGDIPVYINGFYINTLPCEGYGFKVLNCAPIKLLPNATKKIDIAFTPDFTLSKITRTLFLSTSLNMPVNYSLITTIPPMYLSLCSNVITRPDWELRLYFLCVGLMLMSLLLVLLAPMFDSDRILKEALMPIPRQNNIQHTLDLRLIGAQTKSEISQKNEVETQEKPPVTKEECRKTEGEKYTAVMPATGKGKKKNVKKLCDVTESENRKKSWIEAQKLKQEESRQHTDSDHTHKKNIKKSLQTKKLEVKHIEVPAAYEEETSSTTTESSNNEEAEKLKSTSKTKLLKPVIIKNGDEVPETHQKLERKKSNPKTVKPKEPKLVEPIIKTPVELKTKSIKKERKEKQNVNKKSPIEKIPKPIDSPTSISPPTRVSPSVISSNIWTENKASFSDVVARNETLSPYMTPRPLNHVQTAKPTMYVEPYKQTSGELGPIGSRKIDVWRDSASRSPTIPTEDLRDNFFTEAHNLAVESTNAFLDITPTDYFQAQTPSSTMLNYIQTNTNSLCQQSNNTHDTWVPRPQATNGTSTPWDLPYTNPPVNSNSDLQGAPAVSQQSGFLWGSSHVWQPWTPSELPRTPPRTPPGFAPQRDDEEMQRRQQQQPRLTYNPLMSNIWNYPQGQ